MLTPSPTHPDEERGPVEPALALTLDVTHPDCWALDATRAAQATLLGHSFHAAGGHTRGRFTVLGPSRDGTDRVVAAIRDAPPTDAVHEIPAPTVPVVLGRAGVATAACRGLARRDVLVRWNSDAGVDVFEALLDYGFVPNGPCRMRRGREEWPVVFPGRRALARERLAEIERATGAEVRIRRIGRSGEAAAEPAEAAEPGSDGPARVATLDRLTPRQREVFRLACDRDYYGWPRRVSAADLAGELGVSRGTVAEHLRKAESRLFERFTNP